ncbi:hypothetical protein V490_00120 [Pseudogymnoascus sp. VKM F-3557]|nr:hypothetical protein V490_00120 [Pseudogymnoascus sp. VKM F-3557]
MSWPKFINPYVGIDPPPGIHIPELKEVLRDLGKTCPPRSFLAYPTEAPTCWIKYGLSVYWNEVCAQAVAYEGLRQLGSSVRVPAVYYAFKEHPMTYIVMEYIPGKTAGECLEESPEQSDKETIYRSIALALSELHRIPIPKDFQNRPAAVSGGMIRHSIFDCQEAPRHYASVQQLEAHFNELYNLSREPMVFCQSDIFADNFMIDADNRVTAIDFSDTSILPSSFARFALLASKLDVDISQWVHVPVTEGVDNLGALGDIMAPIIQGSYSFWKVGSNLPGGDDEPQKGLY